MDAAAAAIAVSSAPPPPQQPPPPLPPAVAAADNAHGTYDSSVKSKAITLQSVVAAKWPSRKTSKKVLAKLKNVGVIDTAGLRRSLQPPDDGCMLNKMLTAAGARPFVATTVETLLLLLDGKKIDKRVVKRALPFRCRMHVLPVIHYIS